MYILFVLFLNPNYYASPTSMEFSSKEKCEAALVQLVQTYGSRINGRCLEK